MGNNHSNDGHSLSLATSSRKSGNKSKQPESLLKLCKLLSEHSAKDGVGKNISRSTFVKYFSNRVENFAERLYEHYVSKQENLDVHYITQETFLGVSEEILDLRTEVQQLRYCFKVFAKGKDHLTRCGVESLIRASYLLATSTSICTDTTAFSVSESVFVNAVLTSAMKKSDSMSIDTLSTWVRKNCCNMTYGIYHWISHRFLNVDVSLLSDAGASNESKSCESKATSTQSNILNPFLLWLLTCSLPIQYTKPNRNKPSLHRMLSGHLDPHLFIQQLVLCANPSRWTPLYNSKEHGLSMNRFQTHVFSYRGPTVVFITAENQRIFCVAVDQEWRESVNRWGSDGCVVMQITPEYKIIESGSKMVYLNLKTRGYPLGIHIGQNCKIPALEVDCEMTYLFVQKVPYQLFNVEVWGCAGQDMLEAQVQQRRWEAHEAERHHRVNINAVDWKNHPDKYLLELARM